ncbi:MAG: hypothetical protein Q4C96_02740, partial [Planctomycetia bacterium]|nr:hypothetical protein [Planctomycetia bacterium]
MATGSTFGAIAVDGQYWNIMSDPVATISKNNISLKSVNKNEAAFLSYSAANTYHTNLTFNSENALFQTYLDDGGSGVKIQVRDIPYKFYDVYVYAATDVDTSQYRPITVNGVSYSGSNGGTVVGTDNWGVSTQQGSSAKIELEEAKNYLKVSSQYGGLSIQGGQRSGSSRGSIAALQIHEATSPVDWTVSSSTFATSPTEPVPVTTINTFNEWNINNTSGGDLSLTLGGELNLYAHTNVCTMLSAEAGTNTINISGESINVHDTLRVYPNGNTFNISSALTGDGTLSVEGKVTLNNFSSFEGTYAVSSNLTLSNTSADALTVSNAITGIGTLGLSGKFALTNANGFTGTYALTNATDELTLSNGDRVITNTFVGAGKLKLQNGDFNYTGATLSDFKGTIDITGARMRIDSQDDLGSTDGVTVNVNSTGQLYIADTVAFSSNTVINITGEGWEEGAGTLGALRLEQGKTMSGGTVNVIGEATVGVHSNSATLGTAINGEARTKLSKTQNGTLTYTGDSSGFKGDLYVSAGTLNFQPSNSADQDYNNIYVDGGTFNFTTRRVRMTLDVTFTENGGTLTFTENASYGINSHLRSGSTSSTIRMGEEITASSKVTGGLNLNGGTLNLEVGAGSVLEVTGTFWNSGSLVIKGAEVDGKEMGTVKFSNANNLRADRLDSTMQIQSGKLLVEGTSRLCTGAITNNGTLQFNNITTEGGLTVSQVISGTGQVTKSGTGTVTLSGVNKYSGGTTVDGDGL